MNERDIQIGDHLFIQPTERLDCAAFCPKKGPGCAVGAFLEVEVTSMLIAPMLAPRVTPIGTICMYGFGTEQFQVPDPPVA